VAEQAYAYVTLIPVAKGFQQAVAKEMGGVNNVGAKAGQDAGKGFSGGFGGALKALGGVVATGLAAAGVGNFVKESISAASDLEESLNAVSVAYGDASANVVALGEDAAARLGVTQADFNASAVRFSAFAERVVGEGGNVAGFVDDITTRAADFASVFNIDVSEALQVFQSGLSGEAEPLKRFGINLLDSEVQAYALRSGLIGVGEQMTEDIKTQARYGLLMESTAKTQGDFANTSDGLANSQRILKAQFEDIQAEVGGPLLGAFAKLTQGLIPVVEELAPVLVDVMGELAPVIADVAGQIPGLLTSLFPLLPVLGELAGVFLDLVAQLLPVFVDLFAALLPTIVELVPVIADFISEAMAILVPILLDLVDALAPIVQALLPVFMELFEALAPVALQLIEAMLPLIELLLPLFIEFIEFLTPILVTVAEIIGTVLVAAVGFFTDAIAGVTEDIDAFSTFFSEVWTGIKSFFGDIINGLISGFEGFVNGAIKGVNRVIDAINSLSFTVPDWVPEIGGASFGFNLRRLSEISLPRVALADGGLVTGPTTALIGEAGPEVVIPLDRFERMLGDNVEGRTVNYYAAPNKSFDAEQELRLAMTRARVLA
jgi:hypothetical protein